MNDGLLAFWCNLLSGQIASGKAGTAITQSGNLVDNAGDALLTDTGDNLVYTETT